MKTLGACYWYMEHGLEYITFHVQKHIAHFGGLFWSPAGSRQTAWGARISETCLISPRYLLYPWHTYQPCTMVFVPSNLQFTHAHSHPSGVKSYGVQIFAWHKMIIRHRASVLYGTVTVDVTTIKQ